MNVDELYSILIYQERGIQIDWHNVEYYGPFTSPEEREEWLTAPENALDEDDCHSRYALVYLQK